MSAPAANEARQRAHWDHVLSADNIAGGAVDASPKAIAREVVFVRTPDYRMLLRRARALPRPVVLDIGGGLGAHAMALAADCPAARIVVADVSGQRLQALRRRLQRMGLSDSVLLVQTSAEDMALRSGTFDLAWSHSVLIHTVLERSSLEISRVLRAGGEAVLCEPTVSNPLVNLYRRTLAPREWEAITRYFTAEREQTVLNALDGGSSRRLYVLAFLAFVWQFTLPVLPLFRLSLALLHGLDSALMALVPSLRRRAWFTVMIGRGRGA